MSFFQTIAKNLGLGKSNAPAPTPEVVATPVAETKPQSMIEKATAGSGGFFSSLANNLGTGNVKVPTIEKTPPKVDTKKLTETGVDFFASVARAIPRTVATLGKTMSGGKTMPGYNLNNPVAKFVLGEEPIHTADELVEKYKPTTKAIAERAGIPTSKSDLVSKIATPAVVVGSMALDLTGLGGGVKNVAKEAVEQFTKEAVKETSEEVLKVSAKKLLNVSDNEASAIAKKMAPLKNIEDVNKALGVSTKPAYQDWLKSNPEALKRVEDISARAETIPDPKSKKDFLIQEKQKFDTEFSNKYSKVDAIPERKISQNSLDESLKQAEARPDLQVKKGIYVKEAKTADEALAIATKFYKENPQSITKLGKNYHAWNTDSKGNVLDFHLQGGEVYNPHAYVSEEDILKNLDTNTSQIQPGKQSTENTISSLPKEIPKKSMSYDETIQQTGKERKLLTSMKKNPKYEDLFKDTIDNYDPITNKSSIEKAENVLKEDYEKGVNVAYSDNMSVDAQAIRIALIEDAISRGDFEEVVKLAPVARERATDAGQAAQINRLLGGNIDTPAKAVVTAQKQFDGVIDDIAPEFKNTITDVEDTVNKVNREVIDDVIKNTPELKTKTKTLKQQIEKAEIPPEENLARKITPYYNKQKPNAIKDMVNTLYKVAEEVLPKKGKPVPRNAMELIGKALRDKEAYSDIWKKAQDIVKEKYADNDEALELLDTYFKKIIDGDVLPVAQSQINTAVKQGIKEQGIDLSKIVREHYTVAEASGKSLTKKLIEKGNIPTKEAEILSRKIEAKFSEMVKQRKEGILKRIFAERGIKTEVSFADKILEMSNLGAFDKVEFRNALAKKLNIPVLDESFAKQLSEQAQKIGSLPKGYQKYKATDELMNMIYGKMPVSYMDRGANALAVSRAIMSSFDLSFPFRQGLFTLPTNPKIWGSAFKKQFGQFASQKNYEELMDSIIKHPDFDLAEKSGIGFTDISTNMTRREENFMSSYAEKIPFIGVMVKKSGRAYTGTANKLRMDLFANHLDQLRAMGIAPEKNKKLVEDLAKMVNDNTGRGTLPKALEGSAKMLNSVFFSPRLMASRLNILFNPMKYIKAEPYVRKQALKSLVAFGAFAVGTVEALKLAGVDVGTDPNSADFGKARIGNTRKDLFGGFQQYVVLASRIISGKYTSSTTKKQMTIGEGYKPITRLGIIGRFLQSKEAPIASFVADMIAGQDIIGNKVKKPKDVGREFVERLTPMTADSFMDIYKDDPKLLPLGITGIFGVGVQTYPDAAQIIELKRIENSSNPKVEFEKLKKTDPGLAEKVKQAKIQQNYTDEDWSLKGKGVENGERAGIIFKKVESLPRGEQAKYIDDLMKKKLISDIVMAQLKVMRKESMK